MHDSRNIELYTSLDLLFFFFAMICFIFFAKCLYNHYNSGTVSYVHNDIMITCSLCDCIIHQKKKSCMKPNQFVLVLCLIDYLHVALYFTSVLLCRAWLIILLLVPLQLLQLLLLLQ